MRYALLPALVLAASCAPFDGNSAGGNDNGEQSVSRPGATGESATVVIASNGSDCTARWNGEAATAEALVERSVLLLERAIASAGGVENITEETIPYVRVEAAPEVTFACAGPMLSALQRAGFSKFAMRPVGSTEQPQFAYFPLSEAEPAFPPDTIGIGPEGRITWNGTQIDLAGLRARVGRMGGVPEEPLPSPELDVAPPPVVADALPPGSITVAPSSEAPFIAVYRVAQILAGEGETALLVLPDPR